MTHTVSKIVSDETLSRIIQIESGGRPKAKATTSSARGLGQFLNGTWMEELREHRPDLVNGPPFDDELALRTDPRLAIELLARFTEDNVAKLGDDYTDGDVYLAHFSGVGVARKLVRGDEDDPVCPQYYSKAAVNANRTILAGKTVGQVRAWADRKMAAAGKINWVARFMGGPKTVPEIKAKNLTDRETVLKVQQELRRLKYWSAGEPDGDFANFTEDAILAFRKDNNLPITPTIDDELLAALAKAKERPISDKRKEAQDTDVAPKLETVNKSWWSQVWAWVLGIPAAIVSFFKGVLDNFQGASETIEPIKEFFGSVPIEYYALGVVGIATAIWVQSRGAKRAAVAAYQEGRLT